MQTTYHLENDFEVRTSTELAAGSFIIGTLFFVSFLSLQDTSYIFIIGFLFVVAAVVLNAIMLTHLLYNLYLLQHLRKYILLKIIILLSNIPIAYLYFSILKELKIV